jgi:CBS domain-containing protein
MQAVLTSGAGLASGGAALREAIARAQGVGELADAASRITDLAGAALDAGAGVATTTSAISALNDEVTIAVVQSLAAEMGVELKRACWLAFGSQARGEQTFATDQDNGLVFAPLGDGEAERAGWLRFGQRVNEALAACGYPLCDGRVMAGQPLCCLTADEWCRRFEHWLAHGSGNDLLAVRIYFDVRPLTGNMGLAQPIRELLRSPAASVPRFIKQMANVVLCNHVPLNWWGAVVTDKRAGRAMFDLKMSGTALFVDAARLWALAHGIDEVGTEARMRAAGSLLHAPESEVAAWVEGFLTLQRMRLNLQRHRPPGGDPELRCRVGWDALDAADREALKRALRAARWVQQRIQLDYWR